MSMSLRAISRRLPLLSARTSRYSAIRNLSALRLSDVCANPKNSDNIAIIDSVNGLKLSYKELNNIATNLAVVLSKRFGGSTEGAIGAFNKSSVSFVVTMLAAWKLGKVFVPLSISHSGSEIDYIVRDSNVAVICASSQEHISQSFVEHCTLPLIDTKDIYQASAAFAKKTPEDEVLFQKYLTGKDSKNGSTIGAHGALVIYTSGTTGRPKGVLHTHDSLYHMTHALVQSWEYTCQDKILHFLPLYHVHGLVNKLLCVLVAGGTVEFLPSASAAGVWKRFAAEERAYQAQLTTPDADYKPVSLLMAVPTVYARMLESTHTTDPTELSDAVAALKRLRLMACGSAALPDNILMNWEKLTGYKLLERYGMTEIGMALSNPYVGERKQGYVGLPLPGVTCRLVGDDQRPVTATATPGELRIKGPNVFREYLNRPDATAESFDPEGWFRTGDIAEVAEDGYYKILGRNSSDIIKSSGYKLSALEIERELLAHPQILECAVVGVPDEMFGEKVLAIIVLRHTNSTSTTTTTTNSTSTTSNTSGLSDLAALQSHPAQVLQALQGYLADKLAVYKQPREYVVVEGIPRNHMGKVNKKSLRKDLHLD